LGLHPADWTNFLASVGAVLLTFLAGTEIDPVSLRQNIKTTFSIGFMSFLLPFLGATAYTYWVAHWAWPAALIAGIALSTTSVAVVYAVMVETGLNKTPLGKAILTACFITDLGTVIALGLCFASYNAYLVLFLMVFAAVLIWVPRGFGRVVDRIGGRVNEVEVKVLLFLLFGLGALATLASSEAVLPAYGIGLGVAGVLHRQKLLVTRLRTMAFAFLTPFYFLKAGLYVSLPTVVGGAGLITLLLGVKVAAKFIGVKPLTWLFGFTPREGNYMTLLMSTGLTFGTISALFGLNHGQIDQEQYTILATVVILSAIIPTLVAQAFFRPAIPDEASCSAEEQPVTSNVLD
ncbi:MAG: cation:proton antiporter, partial [Cyanobacteria bacterium NC_groundwater_1444_Ag_S-0.65um_54_12]|nr:cation:proton antiporter [Cyanobacteria bacterium NC_groundwater_1444_Ag_S-0.65um_54_12]